MGAVLNKGNFKCQELFNDLLVENSIYKAVIKGVETKVLILSPTKRLCNKVGILDVALLQKQAKQVKKVVNFKNSRVPVIVDSESYYVAKNHLSVIT